MCHRICLFLYILILLVSCQTVPPVVTPTMTPTTEATATVTAVSPTNTALPATPTATPAATAIPLSGIINNQIADSRIHPDEPLVIEFNQPMDTGSSEKPLLFVPDVEGDFSWNKAGTQLVFKPEQGFKPGQWFDILPRLKPVGFLASSEGCSRKRLSNSL